MFFKKHKIHINFLATCTMEALETEFINWAMQSFQCTDSQARSLVTRTQNIFNHGSRTIPVALMSHDIPFAYCSAYLRDLYSNGVTDCLPPRPVTPPLVRTLRKVSSDLGVRLDNFRNDSTLSHLPGYQELCETSSLPIPDLLALLEKIHQSIITCIGLLSSVTKQDDVQSVYSTISDLQKFSSFVLLQLPCTVQ